MFRHEERKMAEKQGEGNAGRYAMLVYIISFAITIMACILFIYKSEKDNLIIRRAHVSRMSDNYVRELENFINSNVAVNYSLNMLIHEGQEGQIDDFNELGRQLLALYPNIRNVSLAPGGTVRQIYPFEGNEAAIGHNVFEDEARVTESTLTKESGVLTVSGPYELIQGGYSILARFPVMMKDESGNKEFWGFTGVAMDVDDIIEVAQISELVDRGYDYELWRINPTTDEKHIISASDFPVVDPEVQEIILPNNKWNLAVSPSEGWVKKSSVYIKLLISFIISIFVGMFLWMLAKLKISKEELEGIAFFDRLTGLPNRRLFFEEFDRMIAKSIKQGRLLAVCYMDLDNFKSINDTYGHTMGDEILKEVSGRCKSVISKSDMMARIGGDEFAFLIYGWESEEEITDILDNIVFKVSQPVSFDKSSLIPSISIGVTIFPYDNNDVDTLLKNADTALYKAKNAGKNQYQFYNEN